MSMPANWPGFGRQISNFPGPGNASGVPVPSKPQPSRQDAARRSFNLIPNQPAPAELAGTIEHLTGRPADPAEVQQVMNDTQATYSDFAPGGQIAPSGTGVMQVQ